MREEVHQEFKASLNYKFIFKRNTHAHKRTGKDNFCHQITLIDNGEKMNNCVTTIPYTEPTRWLSRSRYLLTSLIT